MRLSLNVPVPGTVRRAVESLRPLVAGRRSGYTLVCKRLGEGGRRAATRKRVRRALAGQPAFEVRTDGVDVFERPASGEAPVVYLAVEGPELVALHERLCEVVDPVPDVEGSDYVPHVTVGRAADPRTVERVRTRAPEPHRWTVDTLEFWDATHGESVGRVSLPA